MCTGALCGAVVIGFGVVGALTLVLRVSVAIACVLIAGYAFYRTVSARKRYEIHISGTGQIRLGSRISGHVQSGERTPIEPVRLLSVSTLWPSLLLLHLQNEKRQTQVVTILPDSVSAESFRALLVACRWIVMRHPEADGHTGIGN